MSGWQVQAGSKGQAKIDGRPNVKPTPVRVSPLQPSPGSNTAKSSTPGKRRSRGRLGPGVRYSVSNETFDPFAEAERRIAERMGKEENVAEEEE